MTTAWSWSLMREPWWKSTTLAATPQVRREQDSTAWGRVRCCSVGTVWSWMHYPKSLSSSVVVTTAVIWAGSHQGEKKFCVHYQRWRATFRTDR